MQWPHSMQWLHFIEKTISPKQKRGYINDCAFHKQEILPLIHNLPFVVPYKKV